MASDKEDQVVAVLAARTAGPHFVEPERRLTFTPHKPVIPIGRASKVPTKGFVAAADNAWFDSPVMSRGHAELTVDFNTTPKTIYIKDAGSLHGTFHKRGDGSDGLGKEDKLEPGQMVKLESGDTLRFGIDIYRSKETFPPCCVDFLVEETMDRLPKPDKSAMVSARCFSVSVPEDDFDDEDLLSDSASLVETEIPLPSPHKPISQFPPSRTAGQGTTIDLTQDIAERTSSQNAADMYQSSVTLPNFIDSDIIDLTSEPEQASEPDQISEPEQSSEPPRQDDEPQRERRQSTPFPTVQQQSINVDTSVSSSNVAWQSAREAFYIKARNTFTSVPSASNITDENYDSEVSKGATQAAKTGEDYESELIRRSAAQMADLIYFDTPRYNSGENSPTSGSESPAPSSEEVDSNVTDSEDQSIMSYESTSDLVSQDSDMEDQNSVSSELGEEYGATDDFEDEDEDLHYTDDSSSSDERLNGAVFPDDQSSLASAPSSPVEPEAKILPPKLPAADMTEIEQSSEDPTSHRVVSTAPFTSFVSHQRLPSPSDAAMVKTRPVDSWRAYRSTAQVLGEKTGKYEYFTAREDNRASFINMDRPRSPPIPISAIRETIGSSEMASAAAGSRNPPVHTIYLASKLSMPSKLGGTKSSDASPTVDSPKPVESASSGHKTKEPESACTVVNQDSLWSTSGDKFINSPALAEPYVSRTRLQSPDFDMTSAYTFQQSKLAKENDAGPTVKRVQIQDLLAQEPRSVESLEKNIEPIVPDSSSTERDVSKAQTGFKRTFDDAFEDFHPVESNDSITHVVDNSPTTTTLQELQLSTGPSQPKQDSIPEAVSEGLSESAGPITVRPAKRRRFAEVAACVALGGASVLSALIISAPTFT